jgi:hypothetical protein
MGLMSPRAMIDGHRQPAPALFPVRAWKDGFRTGLQRRIASYASMAYADTRWIRIALAHLRSSLGDKMANLAAAALAMSEGAALGASLAR